MTATTLLLGAALAAVSSNRTILVEASRIDASTLEFPGAAHVLQGEAVSRDGARTLVDTLARQAPEIHLRQLGGNNPALAEIAMRGYGENGHGRTLIVVDGERLNSPDLNTPNLARVALGSVRRLEILGGPQSVLYGDGASAGVINIQTDPESGAQKSSIEVSGGSWGSIGASLGTRGSFEDEALAYWGDASWSRSDGYRARSGFDIWNADIGLKKSWADKTFLRVAAFGTYADYDLPGYLTKEDFRHSPRTAYNSNDWYRRSSEGANAVFQAQLNDENVFRATGAISSRHLHGHSQGAGWKSDNIFDISSARLNLEEINSTDFAGFENELLVGVCGTVDVLDGRQASTSSWQKPDYDRFAADAFLQDTFHLTDRTALTLGGRLSECWSHNSLCEQSRRDDFVWALDAALVFNPTDESKLFAKATRFYRNPFIDEVPGRFDANYTWINTRILKPESGWNFEIGGDWQPTDEFSFGGDLYCSFLDDEIFYNATSANNVNAEDATHRAGADVHATWERDKVAGLSAGVNWCEAFFSGGTFDGNDIPLVPEVTLTVNGRVWIVDSLHVFGGYRYQAEMTSCSDFANSGDCLDDFGVFHVGFAYEPDFAAWARGFKLTFAVENLFNRMYADYGTYGRYYWPAAGRMFTCALRYEF